MKNIIKTIAHKMGLRTESEFKRLADINDNHQEKIKELEIKEYRKGDAVYIQKQGVNPLERFYLIEQYNGIGHVRWIYSENKNAEVNPVEGPNEFTHSVSIDQISTEPPKTCCTCGKLI